MRQTPGHRLFQPDGYTFKCWIEDSDVERMLASGEIRICMNPHTDKAMGYRLVAQLSERITSIASLLPGRTYDPMMQPPSLNYEIPHAGDRGIFARHRRKFIRVSARKIDFTAAPYNQTQPPHSGVATASNVSSSLNSALRTA